MKYFILIFIMIIAFVGGWGWLENRNSVASFVSSSVEAKQIVASLTGVKKVGYFDLTKWLGKPGLFLIARGKDSSGTTKNIVFYKANDGDVAKYIGELSNMFGVDWFLVLPVKVDGKESIIGLTTVSRAIFAKIERPNLIQSKWMCDQFESTVDNGVFFMPFSADIDPNGCTLGSWNNIVNIAVQTKASLQRGYDQKGSYYEQEVNFDAPVMVNYIEL